MSTNSGGAIKLKLSAVLQLSQDVTRVGVSTITLIVHEAQMTPKN